VVDYASSLAATGCSSGDLRGRDARYDTIDHFRIDRRLGDDADSTRS